MQLLIDSQPIYQQQQACFKKIAIPPFQSEASTSWKFIHSNMIKVMNLQHQQKIQRNRNYLNDIYNINQYCYQQCNKTLKINGSSRNHQFFLTQQRENKFNKVQSHSQSIKSLSRRLQSSFFRNTHFQGPFKKVQSNSFLIKNKQHQSKNNQQSKSKNCNYYFAHFYGKLGIKSCKKQQKNVLKGQLCHTQIQKPKQMIEFSPLKFNFKSNSAQKDLFNYLETMKRKKQMIPQRSCSNVQLKLKDVHCRQIKPVLRIKRQNNCINLQPNSNVNTIQNKVGSNQNKCPVFPILDANFGLKGKFLIDKKQILVNPITQKLQPKLGYKHRPIKSVSCYQNSNDNKNQKPQIYLKFHSIPINGINEKVQKIDAKKNNFNGKKHPNQYNQTSVYIKQQVLMNNISCKMMNYYSAQKQNQILKSIKQQKTKLKELKRQKKPFQQHLEKINPIKSSKVKLKIGRK